MIQVLNGNLSYEAFTAPWLFLSVILFKSICETARIMPENLICLQVIDNQIIFKMKYFFNPANLNQIFEFWVITD